MISLPSSIAASRQSSLSTLCLMEWTIRRSMPTSLVNYLKILKRWDTLCRVTMFFSSSKTAANHLKFWTAYDVNVCFKSVLFLGSKHIMPWPVEHNEFLSAFRFCLFHLRWWSHVETNHHSVLLITDRLLTWYHSIQLVQQARSRQAVTRASRSFRRSWEAPTASEPPFARRWVKT